MMSLVATRPLTLPLLLLSSAGSAAAAAGAQGFLVADGPRSARNRAAIGLGASFEEALGVVMGCGEGVAKRDLTVVERALLPIWSVLPKNAHQRVEWKMLRYAAHRYFLQQSSLLVRGLEPARQVNDSNVGSAEILSKTAPSLVDVLLEGSRSPIGFTINDAVALIATIEELIFESESTFLEEAYRYKRKSSELALSHKELHEVMEAYLVRWMIGSEERLVRTLINNHTFREHAFPLWNDLSQFTEGIIKTIAFPRQRAPSAGDGHLVLEQEYSFVDAHKVAGSITRSFASYWETECQTIKTQLVALDKRAVGRISLADFYGANADGQWRFGESEAYLRDLGALDESSPWHGKQVIISNYILGASNCIVSTDHYLVCCQNGCESTLNDIEFAIGAPVAAPGDILSIVENITDFDDRAPRVGRELRAQLQSIADTHGGKVPLHGRLFAQWLHFVFPLDCPFPHKAGTYSTQTPTEFGNDFLVSQTDMGNFAASRNGSAQAVVAEEVAEAQWMSHWSDEEELIADYALQLQAPWSRGGCGLKVVGASAAFILLAGTVVSKKWGVLPSAKAYDVGPDGRSHYV